MKKVIKSVTIPTELIDKVKAYQEKNYIASFSAAVVELLKQALEGA